jgi:flagellar assembly factor FliW
MTATKPAPSAAAIVFTAPMPGLSPYTAFVLEAIDGAAGLYALRAADADVRLFVLDAPAVHPEYQPHIPAAVRAEVGAADDEVLRLFVIANPSDEGVHVNLRAPVVVHPGTGRAVQVILEEQSYPIRALLGGH